MWLTDFERYPEKNIVRKSHLTSFPFTTWFFVCLFFFSKNAHLSKTQCFRQWGFNPLGFCSLWGEKCPFGKGGLYHGKAQVKQNIATFLGEALIFLGVEKNGESRNFLSPKSWACGAPGSESTTVMFQWVFHPPIPFPLQNCKILSRGLGGSWVFSRFVTTRSGLQPCQRNS